jgi:hypothetical protein
MTMQRKKAPASAFPHLTECHSPESKQPLHCGPGIAARQAIACAATLDSISTVAKNAGVAFNSATEIGVSNPVADSRLHAAFFTSVNNTIGASLLWRAVVGECLHSPVSTGPVRQSRHVPATPDWRREAGLNDQLEATMPKSFRRALRTLFPLVAVPISTLPTQAEAHALAALLVSQGRRACIQPCPKGFTVAEVRA